MSIFNFDSVTGENFLRLDLHETVMLTIAVAVLVVMLAVGIALKLSKSNAFEGYVKLCPLLLTLFSIALIVYCVVVGFDSFSEQYQLWLFVGLFLVIASCTLFSIVSRNKNPHTARSMAIGGICIAISFALSYIRFFKLPQGGSITLASLALIALYSYMFGIGRGVLIGLVYGVLQSIQDPWVVHPIQYILDYPLAFAMIGLVGLFRNKLGKPQLELLLGFLVAIVGRYICHFFSGSIFFGEYGADFGILNHWSWGAIYNLFVFADGIIAYIVTSRLIASRSVKKILFESAEA